MRHLIRLTPLALLAACGTQEGTEKGDLPDTGTDPCVDITQEEIPVDEVSPLGFSGQDVLDWLSAGAEAPLAWVDGSDTTIRFGFGPGERGVHYEQMTQNPETTEPCEQPDRLLVGVAYTVETDDGRLDEQGEYLVWVEQVDAARLVVNTSGTGGPLDACVPGDGAEQELEATFTPGTTTGDLWCEGEHTEEMASW